MLWATMLKREPEPVAGLQARHDLVNVLGLPRDRTRRRRR